MPVNPEPDPRPWWHLRDMESAKEGVQELARDVERRHSVDMQNVRDSIKDLSKEVERRDRDLAERITAVDEELDRRVRPLEESSPVRRLAQLEDSVTRLTYTLIGCIVGIPAATVGLLTLLDLLRGG